MKHSSDLARAQLAFAVCSLSLYGCARSGDSPAPDGRNGLNRTHIVAAEPPGRERTLAVAIIDGRPLRQADLLPLLLEIGGLQAITEAILDQRIEAEALRQGIAIAAEDVAREEALLAAALPADADSAVRLLDSVRTSRGLGPVRYAALLRRNALLRAMVEPDVAITQEDIAVQFDLLHGEKRQPRMITVPNLAAAVEIVQRLQEDADFSDLAVELSTDASAARGGLLAPISRGDVSYPEQVRATLWTLEPGETSAPIMLDGSMAILMCERIIPPSGTAIDDVRGEMEELARRRQERILMESLAQRLLESASITILDAELDRQWRRTED